MLQHAEEKFAIHQAARDKKALLVQHLISEDPSLFSLKDDDERTPLHWACSADDIEIVKILLKIGGKGVDLDDLVDSSGWTPFHIACALGSVPILQELMNHEPQPDVNLLTNQGTTGLHLAVSKNHYELVEKLVVEYKCKCQVKDKKGYTGLHRAASIGSQPIIRLLVKHGKVNLNAQDKDGWSAMHHALAEGHGDTAALLINLGADVNIQNNNGEVPLQVAVDEKVRHYFQSHII